MVNGGLVPSVAVVIPCRDEEACLERCLDSIVANHYPADRLEIIVVDGLSQDRTRAIADQYANRYSYLRVLDNSARTIPAAMNLGITRSTSEIIIKVDAHSTYPKDYIGECVRHLFTCRADMTGGVFAIAPRTGTLIAKSIATALSHWFGSGNAYIKIGLPKPRWTDAAAFGCWRRETFQRLGLFDERLAGSSDMDFNRRLIRSGGRILVVPQIEVTYYADADITSFWNHNFSDGVWTTYSLKFGKYVSSCRHLIPFGFVSVLIVLAAAGVVSEESRFLLGLVAVGASYGALNMAASVQLCARTKSVRSLGLFPMVFAVRHLAHGLGALYGLLLVALPGVTWRGRRAGIKEHGYPGRRILDLIASLSGLLILFPWFVVLSILIKLDSRGPVFYGGERLGRFGRPFKMLKFRTMCSDAEQSGALITPEDDSRITRVGGFLRKYKLDELPQLINVLKGEMSLVGPRPEASYYFRYYAEHEKLTILSVQPGMTDYGSLRFHDEGKLLAGSTDPVKTYVEQIRHEKVREQLRYIREQSFVTDLKIILRTIATLISTRFRQSRTVRPTVSPRA